MSLSSDQFKIDEVEKIRMVQDSLVQGVSTERDFHTKAYNEYIEGLFKNLISPLRGPLSPLGESVQAIGNLPGQQSVPLVVDWLSRIKKAAVCVLKSRPDKDLLDVRRACLGPWCILLVPHLISGVW